MKKVVLVVGLILLFSLLLLVVLLPTPTPRQQVVEPGIPLTEFPSGDRDVATDEFLPTPMVEGGETTTDTTPDRPNLPPKRYLTEVQHAAVFDQGKYLGDEAAYDIVNDDRLHVWFSGVNDVFYVDLLGADVTANDRARVNQILATLLGVPTSEVCDYTILVEAPNTPFQVDTAITSDCPVR